MAARVDFSKLTLMDTLDLAALIEREAFDRYSLFAEDLGRRLSGDDGAVFQSMAENERKHGNFPSRPLRSPWFVFLGTPGDKKEWKVYDGCHFVPRDQLIKETLAWLDRYLGPVK